MTSGPRVLLCALALLASCSAPGSAPATVPVARRADAAAPSVPPPVRGDGALAARVDAGAGPRAGADAKVPGAPPWLVFERHNPALGILTFQVSAGGEARLAHGWNQRGAFRGRVADAELTRLRATWDRGRCCRLRSYSPARGRLSNSTVVELALPGLACRVERPDPAWQEARAAACLQAVRALQRAACGGPCPDVGPGPRP